MKNLIVLLVLFLSVSFTFAQDSKDASYEVKGDLISAELYHDNGKIAQTGFYTLDNKLQGEWNSYDLNGNKTAIGHYDNGKKVGTWTFFQGEKMKVVDYNNSKIAQVKTWQVTDTRVVSNLP